MCNSFPWWLGYLTLPLCKSVSCLLVLTTFGIVRERNCQRKKLSLEFKFAFPWWLIMLNIFLNHVYLLLSGICWSLLLIFNWLVCLFVIYSSSLHILDVKCFVKYTYRKNFSTVWLVFWFYCCCCCCWVTSVVSDSVRPQRWQPTRREHWSGLPFPSPMHEKWKVKGKSLSHVQLLATPWTVAYQAPLSMGFSRQEYWSGVPLPSPTKR